MPQKRDQKQFLSSPLTPALSFIFENECKFRDISERTQDLKEKFRDSKSTFAFPVIIIISCATVILKISHQKNPFYIKKMLHCIFALTIV